MYRIICDGKEIVRQGIDRISAINGRLTQQINAADQLTFTLPATHPYLSNPQPRSSIVELWRDNECLFIGDVLQVSSDIYNNATFTCQGALAWLNDSVVPHPSFSGSASEYFERLITKYSGDAEQARQLNFGASNISTSIQIEYLEDIKSVFELVSLILSNVGGYLFLRYEGDGIYVDYLTDKGRKSGQTIRFGENLTGIENFIDASKFITRVYPVGKDGLDIRAVNDGKWFVANSTLEATHGVIAATVEYSDIEDANALKTLATNYLNASAVMGQTLALTAIDLSLLDSRVDRIEVGDAVKVQSKAHGLDTTLKVVSKETDIINPENSKLELGLTMQSISGMVGSGGGATSVSGGSVTPVGAVLYNQAQSLTEEEKAQARANIGAGTGGGGGGDLTGAVRYDVAQALTNAQKQRARQNIGAGTSNFDGRYSSLEGRPTIPTKTSQLINDSRFIGSETMLVVNATQSGTTISADATFEVINTAINDGIPVVVGFGGETFRLYDKEVGNFAEFRTEIDWSATSATQNSLLVDFTDVWQLTSKAVPAPNATSIINRIESVETDVSGLQNDFHNIIEETASFETYRVNITYAGVDSQGNPVYEADSTHREISNQIDTPRRIMARLTSPEFPDAEYELVFGGMDSNYSLIFFNLNYYAFITLVDEVTVRTIGHDTGVRSVNGKTGTVELTATDVNALPANTTIPTKTSQLTNNSGFITSAIYNPTLKTSGMTTPVGRDTAGKLWVGMPDVSTDITLTIPNKAADAKAVGDALDDIVGTKDAEIGIEWYPDAGYIGAVSISGISGTSVTAQQFFDMISNAGVITYRIQDIDMASSGATNVRYKADDSTAYLAWDAEVNGDSKTFIISRSESAQYWSYTENSLTILADYSALPNVPRSSMPTIKELLARIEALENLIGGNI